ncbi:MAG: T9SS type A sorting domain-containing protein, partial [Bacteroidales bacterium]|nr:T9SS type A sorting domain-containing protein [Bacteroidales bacterium]
HSDALNSFGNLLSTYPDITINTAVYNLNTIAAGNSVDAIFNITVDPLSSIDTVVDLDYTVNALPYSDQKTFYPSIGLIVEDWESGGFNTFNWSSSSNAPWTIDNINQYEGLYCVRSGAIGNSSSSVLELTAQVLSNDSISFFRKVSSESGYDYLKFYIDTNLQGQWAGEQAWIRFSYPVSLGLHTFKWEYSKDYTTIGGDDCAWVDFIDFPPINIPSLDAGVCKIYDLPGQSAFHDIRVDIKNFGLDSLTSATIDWEVDGVSGSSYYWTGNLPKDGIDGPVTLGNYNFTNGWHNIRAWTTIPNGGIDGFNFNDTLEIDAYFISPISTFPYCESFENGPGVWQQPINDDFDWTRNSGSTQSGSTGPSGAYDGTYYMYTESSNPRVDGDEAFFDAEFNFSSLSSPELTFHYHMYGNGMGTLYVDVFDSVWHMGVWSLSGNQGNTWFQAVVNLSAYANKANIAIRLRGEVGSGSGSTYRSDMAIDLVCVHELVPIYCIPYSGCTNGDGIEDFVLNTIIHMGSGCSPGGYGDFTNMQTNLIPGGTYSMSVSSNYANQYVSLWIDMDANYNFDNSERLISDFQLPTAGPLYTDNLIIPASAAPGLYRMRVRARWDATSINPCDTFTYGETHDYMVNIIPDTTLIVNAYPDTSICVGDSVTLFVGITGVGAPFTYLWNDGNTSSSIVVSPNNTTFYTVTVTDAFLNTASDNVHIIVYQLPQILFQPNNAYANMNGNAQFSVFVSSGFTYQWQVKTNAGMNWTDLLNNTIYSGVNTDTLNLANCQMSMNGYFYRCRIVNAHSCYTVSDVSELSVIPVPTITTEAVSYTGCMGNIVVPVTATNFNNVASISLTMDYDTTHLIWTGYQNLHPALAGGTLIVNASGGKIIITWFDLINVSFGDNTILELIFTSVGGTSTLNWDILTPGACQYSDISAYVFPSLFIDGVINTFSCSSIAGDFTYLNQDSTPLTNTQLYAYNVSGYVQDSTISGPSGDYNFPYLPLGSYSIMANINKVWGGVNASDALMIMMHFAGMINLSGLNLDVADVDVSGYVNTLDALMCAQRFVGMINSFPSGDWAHDIDTMLINGTAPVIYNFNGLCFGDVNSNYLPPTIKAEPLLSLETNGILEVMSNEDIVIPLSVNKDMDINAISLILNYPTQLFKFKKLELMAKHGVLQYKEINGEIRISWYSTNSLEIKESEALLYLSLSPVTFDYSKLNKSIFTIQGISELADKNAKTIPLAKLVMPELVSVSELKGGFYLGQNYPNPYNDYTEIEYTLVESGKVNLEVFNTLGEKVDVIINDKMQNAGPYKAKFNASKFPPGIYYYRMNVESESGSATKTRIMIIVSGK